MKNSGEIMKQVCKHNAEGAVAINSQAKGPDFDDTLESNGAPKK